MMRLDVWGNPVYGFYASPYYSSRDFYYLQSIYVSEFDVSICLMTINVAEHKIIPEQIWTTSSSSVDIISKAKENHEERRKHFSFLESIINPDKSSTSDNKSNILARFFSEELMSVGVVDEFEPSQGLVALRRRESCKNMDYSKFEDWERIQAEIEAIRRHQSSTGWRK